MGGMVLAFFAPNLSVLNLPNIFDRYRYLLKHKLECNIHINGNDDDQTTSISMANDSCQPASQDISRRKAVEFAKGVMRDLKNNRSVPLDDILRETVDKVFKDENVRKSLGKSWQNLSQHGNLESVVGKLSKIAIAPGTESVDELAKTVGNIFSEVKDLDDDNTDNCMRKIFEHLHDGSDDSDDYTSSE